MDPDPLRLLETAHPVRSPALLPSSPNSRFRLRSNYRLTHPETVNKRVNKIVKNIDGPTQMSRRRSRPRPFGQRDVPAAGKDFLRLAGSRRSASLAPEVQ